MTRRMRRPEIWRKSPGTDDETAQTPKDILQQITEAFRQARQSPDVVQKLNAIGQAVSVDNVGEATAALRSEAQQWKQLIADRGIKFGK
jgi:tripartite-type tricarboxylate transporter receptor subunit TctC